MNVEKIKEGTKKLKNWMVEHKIEVLTSTGLLVTAAVATALLRDADTKMDNQLKELAEPIKEAFDDGGKDIEIHYVDPENGKVLWKGLCSEEYVNDMKECEMEYENFRKLNGLE